MIPRAASYSFLMGVNQPTVEFISSGWCVPSQEFIDSFEPGDLRLPATVLVYERIGYGETLQNIIGFVPSPEKDYHYFNQKYYNPPYTYTGARTGDNFPIYRYADALLLLAECLVEQNKAGEAQPYLDKVRARAGLDPVPATKQSVSDERRHELAFENKRWTDLIRTGQAIEVMTAFGEYWLEKDEELERGVHFVVTQERLLYPFPARELIINRNLVQNPGYR